TSEFISGEIGFPFSALLYPSLRYDGFSDQQGDVSPKIGISVPLTDDRSLRVHSSYGKNYRVPSFDDLYWIPGGNPHLSPERALSFDAGMAFDAELIGTWSGDVTYFNIDADNLIEWQPQSNGIWSPVNINKVKSTGLESRIDLQLFDRAFSLGVSETILNAIKVSSKSAGDLTANTQLIYRPRAASSVFVSGTYGIASLSIHESYNGFRYYSETNDPRYILPNFYKFDANLTLSIPWETHSVRIKAEVNNASNTDYQLIADYPMPLRTYTIGIEIHY
ncbi:MAG TPA: TonB-dependent receptor, partial [Bacteroidota bacterium]|nr:TonB-dependent receptor [Bacteroidota bacterium]